MNTSRMRKGLSVVAVAGLSMGMLAGCSSGGTSESKEESATTEESGTEEAPAASGNQDITFLPKNLGNPYFDASFVGATEAVDSFGGTITQVGPAEATAESQVSYINTATQQGVGSLIVAANDKAAICDALNEARDAGTKVVTFDSDTNVDCRDIFVSQADAEGIARVQVEMVADKFDGKAKVAILSASANATNQNEWIDLMKEEVAANYPDIEIVDVVYGDDDDQLSFDQTAGLLQTYPDLDAIIAPTTVGIAAAARYVSTSEAKGKVFITGLGTPNQMREYIKDGTVEEFALWNPTQLGYLTAFTAKALMEGTITGAEGDTFEAGDLGSYTVGADGVVVLGDPQRFTAENIDDFDY